MKERTRGNGGGGEKKKKKKKKKRNRRRRIEEEEEEEGALTSGLRLETSSTEWRAVGAMPWMGIRPIVDD